MNKLLLVIILCLSSLFVKGQNTLSVLYAPTDARLGLRYDHQVKVGYYLSASYGNYRAGELYLNDHYKYAGGISFCGKDTFFSLGLSYHEYGKNNLVKQQALKPVSFDFGSGARIGRFIAGFMFDPNKWEGEIFAGIKF